MCDVLVLICPVLDDKNYKSSIRFQSTMLDFTIKIYLNLQRLISSVPYPCGISKMVFAIYKISNLFFKIIAKIITEICVLVESNILLTCDSFSNIK